MSSLLADKKFIVEQLEDSKAMNIIACDVRKITDYTDVMIICSSSSSRHIQAIASILAEKAKKTPDLKPLRVEGKITESEWVIVDFGHIVVHVMSEEIRDEYKLETLWCKKEENILQ